MKKLFVGLLALPVIALLTTVFLPFVNTPTIWFGLPSVMVWSVVWVFLITAGLALLEFGTRHPEDQEEAR